MHTISKYFLIKQPQLVGEDLNKSKNADKRCLFLAQWDINSEERGTPNSGFPKLV